MARTPLCIRLVVNAHLWVLEFDHGSKGLGSSLKTACQRDRAVF